ncbi:MAG: aldo/keto reductase [Armatimonadetes bacterium]|nr:aldo/keto reductase [Armatimonadota bacterium]
MPTFNPDRYKVHNDWFRHCGRSGLKLPAISLGCWHNFGDPGTDAAKHQTEEGIHDNARQMLVTAFDNGITHFDLANNYGPKAGAAETRVGRILASDFQGHRDELVISTKAGYWMWDGPYGDFGSRKYLLSSLDQSLRRLQLDYVDIFYHHRPDPNTPIEETMSALDTAVRSGKALYAGLSNYHGKQLEDALAACEKHGFYKPIINQPSYSMFNRWIESDLLDSISKTGTGVIAFCPLAQGLLTKKYLGGIPDDSRAKQEKGFLREDGVTPELVAKAQKLDVVAGRRGQTLAQLALLWTIRDPRVTSALIGASRPQQVLENVKVLESGPLTDDELAEIEAILA